MIQTLLIANRGEIACRIIKTAQARGIRCVAVYSDADKNAPHVQMADQAVALGGNTAEESYLRGGKIIDIAKETGCDAVHPGYGFLSENADFAQQVADASMIFIGPTPEAISIMGNKAAAKERMREVGVPCIEGYNGADQSVEHLSEQAQKIGLPLMIKAVAGGGGRGMRFIHDFNDIKNSLNSARTEAEASFGNGDLILERAYLQARHIELQIAADKFGNTIHLFERDCSAQRRHQKVVEEAPSPALDDTLRGKMGQAAIEAAKSVGYIGLGTVEFLLDQEGNFFFLEMNTRLQVEHPVTEEIINHDLVAMQLDIANGNALPSQNEITHQGHSIELRLYAEDPAKNFMPSIGDVTCWHPCPSARVDAAIESGSEISPFYDAMVAKIIVHGATRQEALRQAQTALAQTVALGISTNTDFLSQLLESDVFQQGRMTTDYIDTAFLSTYAPAPMSTKAIALAAALWAETALQHRVTSAAISEEWVGWSTLGALRHSLNLEHEECTYNITYERIADKWHLSVDQDHFEIVFDATDAGRVHINQCAHRIAAHVSPESVDIAVGLIRARFSLVNRQSSRQKDLGNTLTAPLPSKVQSLNIKVNQIVNKGDTLIVLEAMKMQHPLVAPCDGKVQAIHIEVGDQIARGTLLLEIDADTKDAASE